MFHYELHRIREAELLREAADYRRTREATERPARLLRGRSAPQEEEGQVNAAQDRPPARRRRAAA